MGAIVTVILVIMVTWGFVIGLRKLAQKLTNNTNDCCGSGGCLGCRGNCYADPKPGKALPVKVKY